MNYNCNLATAEIIGQVMIHLHYIPKYLGTYPCGVNQVEVIVS